MDRMKEEQRRKNGEMLVAVQAPTAAVPERLADLVCLRELGHGIITC